MPRRKLLRLFRGRIIRLKFISLCLLALGLLACSAVAKTPVAEETKVDSKPSFNCEIGPVEKTIGGNLWVVSSCDDGKSVVFVSHKTNPAMPFYFLYRAGNGKYHLNGQGTGDKAATKPAYEELKSYDEVKLNQIIAETKLAFQARNLKPSEKK